MIKNFNKQALIKSNFTLLIDAIQFIIIFQIMINTKIQQKKRLIESDKLMFANNREKIDKSIILDISIIKNRLLDRLKKQNLKSKHKTQVETAQLKPEIKFIEVQDNQQNTARKKNIAIYGSTQNIKDNICLPQYSSYDDSQTKKDFRHHLSNYMDLISYERLKEDEKYFLEIKKKTENILLRKKKKQQKQRQNGEDSKLKKIQRQNFRKNQDKGNENITIKQQIKEIEKIKNRQMKRYQLDKDIKSIQEEEKQMHTKNCKMHIEDTKNTIDELNKQVQKQKREKNILSTRIKEQEQIIEDKEQKYIKLSQDFKRYVEDTKSNIDQLKMQSTNYHFFPNFSNDFSYSTHFHQHQKLSRFSKNKNFTLLPSKSIFCYPLQSNSKSSPNIFNAFLDQLKILDSQSIPLSQNQYKNVALLDINQPKQFINQTLDSKILQLHEQMYKAKVQIDLHVNDVSQKRNNIHSQVKDIFSFILNKSTEKNKNSKSLFDFSLSNNLFKNIDEIGNRSLNMNNQSRENNQSHIQMHEIEQMNQKYLIKQKVLKIFQLKQTDVINFKKFISLSLQIYLQQNKNKLLNKLEQFFKQINHLFIRNSSTLDTEVIHSSTNEYNEDEDTFIKKLQIFSQQKSGDDIKQYDIEEIKSKREQRENNRQSNFIFEEINSILKMAEVKKKISNNNSLNNSLHEKIEAKNSFQG